MITAPWFFSRSRQIFGFLCCACFTITEFPVIMPPYFGGHSRAHCLSQQPRPSPGRLHSLPYHNIEKQFLWTAVNQRQKSKMLPQSLSDFQLVNWFHRLLLSKLHFKWKAEPSIFERGEILGPLGFTILKQRMLWKKCDQNVSPAEQKYYYYYRKEWDLAPGFPKSSRVCFTHLNVECK